MRLGVSNSVPALGLRGLGSQGWCENATCVGNLEWYDGEAFSWDSWMDQEISLWRPHSADCFVIDFPPVPAPLFQVRDRFCTGTGHLIVCEKSCVV